MPPPEPATGGPIGRAPVADLVRLAAFVRARLADVAGLAGVAGRAAGELLGSAARPEGERTAPRAPDTVVVAPAATFAPTSHARARLLRQLHASGLLTHGEVELALTLEHRHRALPPGA